MYIKMIPLLAICGLATAAFGQITIDGISFVDQAAAGRIVLGDFGGGLGVFDYDNDGFPDLFISGSNGIAKKLFHNVPDPARPGNRTFNDVSVASGLNDPDGITRYNAGVLAGDYDNDGFVDLYLTGYDFGTTSSGQLYRNNGNGTFSNVSIAAGVRSSGSFPHSASWVDFNLDGRLDILIASRSGQALRLLRNNGNGTFADATSILPSISTGSAAYSHVWIDDDGDGDSDCYMLTTAAGPTVLRNVVDGSGRHFINAASAVGFNVLGPAPMGIAAGDADNDGDMDIAISNGAVGVYYRNNFGTANTMTQVFPFATQWGWGVTWIDADNDGRLDNYQAGSVSMPGGIGQGANHDVLMRNLGNWQFSNVSAALNSTLSASRDSVQIDFNNDGRQDLITINPGTPGDFISVYENLSTTGNHWLKVKAVGDGTRINRDAIGAVVRLTAGGATQVREIFSGSSTTATEDIRAHFGLGAMQAVERIEIVWPRSGSVTTRTQIFTGPFAVDQIITLGPPCLADFNLDHESDFFDYLDFVDRLSNLDSAADVNADGIVDFFDYLDFVDAFSAGC